MEKNFPIITLSNGIKVANFSSPHSFQFSDGSVLPACSDERAAKLMLHATEVEEQYLAEGEDFWWTDITLKFSLSDDVEKALIEAIEFCHGTETREFHVLLVPFPVLTSLKEAFSEIDNLQHRGPDSSYEKRNRWQLLQDCIDLCRTIRVADRVNKILHADRFCK